MRWMFFVMTMTLCLSVFGQNAGDSIVGKWRRVNADTLRMYFQNYIRVAGDAL
jgi:hypothetical protein